MRSKIIQRSQACVLSVAIQDGNNASAPTTVDDISNIIVPRQETATQARLAYAVRYVIPLDYLMLSTGLHLLGHVYCLRFWYLYDFQFRIQKVHRTVPEFLICHQNNKRSEGPESLLFLRSY